MTTDGGAQNSWTVSDPTPVPVGSRATGAAASSAAPATPAPAATGSVTAASAREFLIALTILIVFVIVMTMLAGTSPAAGKGILTFFLILLFLQAVSHVNPFLSWIESV